MSAFPWFNTPPPRQAETPRETFLRRLSEGVPRDLACRAYGVTWEQVKDDPEIDKAVAEGQIALFEKARDQGVTGAIRAAMREEALTWQAKAEVPTGLTLEELLRG